MGLRRLALVGVVSAVASVSLPAMAARNDQAGGGAASNDILASLRRYGATLTDLGDIGGGLRLWVARKDGRAEPILTSADGSRLIVGIVYDKSGHNLTAQKIEAAKLGDQFKPAPSPSKRSGIGNQLLGEFERAHWVRAGADTAPVLYMLVDPMCGWCKSAWRQILPYVDKGQIQVRLVPVGKLTRESVRASARLFEVPEPAKDWNLYVSGTRDVLDGQPKEDSQKIVKANNELMLRWNISETPYFVFRAASGKVKIVRGVPSSIPQLVAELQPVK